MPLDTDRQLPLVGPVVIGEYFRYPGAGSDGVPFLTLQNNLAGDMVPIKAILELRANDGAFVVPRMTFAQMNLLDPVANGSIVYLTDLQLPYLYENGAWLEVATGPTVEFFTWVNNVVLDTPMLVDHGYFTDGAVLVTLTLPAVCETGDRFIVYGDGTGLFRIAQNAGQQIRFNNALTTVGVAGHIAATSVGACIQIVCRNANTDFKVITSEGNFDVT